MADVPFSQLMRNFLSGPDTPNRPIPPQPPPNPRPPLKAKQIEEKRKKMQAYIRLGIQRTKPYLMSLPEDKRNLSQTILFDDFTNDEYFQRLQEIRNRLQMYHDEFGNANDFPILDYQVAGENIQLNFRDLYRLVDPTAWINGLTLKALYTIFSNHSHDDDFLKFENLSFAFDVPRLPQNENLVRGLPQNVNFIHWGESHFMLQHGKILYDSRYSDEIANYVAHSNYFETYALPYDTGDEYSCGPMAAFYLYVLSLTNRPLSRQTKPVTLATISLIRLQLLAILILGQVSTPRHSSVEERFDFSSEESSSQDYSFLDSDSSSSQESSSQGSQTLTPDSEVVQQLFPPAQPSPMPPSPPPPPSLAAPPPPPPSPRVRRVLPPSITNITRPQNRDGGGGGGGGSGDGDQGRGQRRFVIPQIKMRLQLPKHVAYENPRTHQFTMVPILTRTGLISTRNKQKVLKITLDNSRPDDLDLRASRIPIDRFTTRGPSQQLSRREENVIYM